MTTEQTCRSILAMISVLRRRSFRRCLEIGKCKSRNHVTSRICRETLESTSILTRSSNAPLQSRFFSKKSELPKNNNNNNKILENHELPSSNNNSVSSNYRILSSADTSSKSICIDEFISAMNTVSSTNSQNLADVQEDGNQHENENNTRKNDSQTSTNGSISPEISNIRVTGGAQHTDILNNSVDDRPQKEFPPVTDKTKSYTSKIERHIISNGPETNFSSSFETSLASQANGCVFGIAGDTFVLSTVVCDNIKNEEQNATLCKSIQITARKQSKDTFLPFTVNFLQRHHATGTIPSHPSRRDTIRTTDDEILAARAVDRSLRPMLPLEYYNGGGEEDMRSLNITCSVQACYPLTCRKLPPSIENTNMPSSQYGDPVALAVNSASAALLQSNLPFQQPVACVRLALLCNGKVLIDPTPTELETSKLDLLYSGTKDRVLMIEFCSKTPQISGINGYDGSTLKSLTKPGVPEDVVTDMIRLAHDAIQPILEAQKSVTSNSEKKDESSFIETSDESLALELGIPNIEITTVEDSKTVGNLDNCRILADKLFQKALEFTKSRLDVVSLRLFGYNSDDASLNKDIRKQKGKKFKVAIHDNQDSNLLLKKIRGRKETLVFAEVRRLLHEEFNLTNDDELGSLYESVVVNDRTTMMILCQSITTILLKQGLHKSSVDYGCRADRRGSHPHKGIHTIRPISVTVPLLPESVHGSSLFSRGETQVLSTVTLGAPREGQRLDNPYKVKLNLKEVERGQENNKGPFDDLPVGSLRYLKSQMALESDLNSKRVKADREMTGDSGTLDEYKTAFLHYEFPAYSTGTIQSGGMRTDRRAIGHGTLAEKGILPVLPSPSNFPYAIRMTSEVTSSNGSSSMATVCGATLALLDAGVPLTEPVAGVSVGLARKAIDVDNDSSSECLLLDITGTEDYYGEMDFKIVGTQNGVTAMQLDVKTPLQIETIIEAMELAKQGRISILKKMNTCSNNSSCGVIKNLKPRSSMKKTAPRVEVVRFDPLRKRDLIGPGGAVLRQLEDRFGVYLDLSQEGQCLLHGRDSEMVSMAKAAVMDLVADVEEGEVYKGTVIEIKDFGAVIELLVRLSQLGLYCSSILNRK